MYFKQLMRQQLQGSNICHVEVMLQIRIKDETGEIDATAFEEAGTELVGLTSEELSSMRENEAQGDDVVYDKLEEIVGKQYYFNLKVTEYNSEDPSKPPTIAMAWPCEPNPTKRPKKALLFEGSSWVGVVLFSRQRLNLVDAAWSTQYQCPFLFWFVCYL